MEVLDTVRDLGPRVRELADETESGRRLAPELADSFGRTGVWRLSVPTAVGGLELPLAAQLEAYEELARADGSAGWCAMIAGTTGIVYAHLDADMGRTIFDSQPQTCTGGVFAPSGRGDTVDGGLNVNGRWAFCSGVEHSDWLSLGVVVDEADVRAVLVPRSDVDVIDTWTVSGLRGTGSHDVTMHDVFVPSERVFLLIGDAPRNEGPLYAFPVLGLLALGVASVMLGIARSSVDELGALAGAKTPTGSRRRLAERAHTQMEVAQATAELEGARSFVYAAINEAWQGAESGEAPTIDLRARLRLAATHAARTSARVVDRMYEAGGGSSIYATSRLQRDFRDVHAATQHMVIGPATLELVGRILLGVETDVTQL